MPFLLVPHQAARSTATVWGGAIDENVRAQEVCLEFEGADDHRGEIYLDASAWERWRSYHPADRGFYLPWDWVLATSEPKVRRLYYQRITIGQQAPLTPRTSYSLGLRVGGLSVLWPESEGRRVVGMDWHLRSASVTTVPERLPQEGEKPFTVLLGSCFYGPEDPDGLAGATYRYLPEKRRPDVKVLCGDQVYLDNPWCETTFNWYMAFGKPGLFRAMLFEKYEANWKQVRGEDAGFRMLLKDGANWFCSDDHEFWNNAPHFGGVGLFNTLTLRQRGWWFREATILFRAFQSPSPLMTFEVPPLSFCVADTRLNRGPRGKRFMLKEDLGAVKGWISSLEGPGVLAVGQPLLVEKANLRRSIREEKDWKKGAKKYVASYLDKNLADHHEQYEELVGAIKAAKHSVVILTGDVHFGRYAEAELETGSSRKLVEVISSPIRAVPDEKGDPMFGTYEEPTPEHFPKVGYEKPPQEQNHFATVEFSSSGGKVAVTARYWPVLRPEDGGELTPPESPFETVL